MRPFLFWKAVRRKKTEMVKIRLRREGTKNRPYYKVVVCDNRARRDGEYLEQVGMYDPMTKDSVSSIDLERVDKWLGNGAQPTDTVKSLIKKARQMAKA
jgi:small subunit ribosomal protein S16